MTASLAWFSYINEWELREKVDFDGINRLIRVYPGVTQLNIRSELYSAWIRWLPLQNNTAFLPAMRYSGFDPIPGGETGGFFFLINNWKLVLSIENTEINGVLYSDDYPSAYFDHVTMNQVYPAQVSSYVSSVVVTQNVITATKEDIANTTWNHQKALTVPKFIGLK
jgi:hypothetical protein